MPPRLYSELASWWPVMSAPEDYAEEAGIYHRALQRFGKPPLATVLELGSGGGNNASHLKAHYQLTLADLSPEMLAVSRQLNPGCEHVQGDMRTLRLDRAFDAVFIHDAIAYMTTEDDLRAALATAFHHCRPGGVALFAPDETREIWRPSTDDGGHDLGDRSLRYLQWCFDPDPDDTAYICAFTFMLREAGKPLRHAFDQHTFGFFPRATWLELIADVGFEPRTAPYPHSEFDPDVEHELFLGLRPELTALPDRNPS